MFNKKQTSLFAVPAKQTSAKAATPSPANSDNPFVRAALQKSAETLSGNGAKKYSTTGNALVDQFGVLGSYKAPRPFEAIVADCQKLSAEDRVKSILFTFYLRMITRTVQLPDGTVTSGPQRGAELKHEGIMRMIWLHMTEPQVFWDNIGLFVAVGSWKDVITMLQYDLTYNGWDGRKLDWNKFGSLILSGLENKNTSELLKKYLPSIKARSACKTVDSQADNLIGKWICSLLFGAKDLENQGGSNYKKYRKLKSSGTAHEWQQLISQGKHDLIDFSKIHGRALNQLVKSKYLNNQGLSDKFTAWITKPETTGVKYTGFVHELFEGFPGSITQLDKNRKETTNKQFETLVEKGGQANATKLIVVRDTSGSMGSTATGTKMSCYNVAKALALYFSAFLTGKFQDAWIEFNSDAKMHTWSGATAVDRWFNDKSGYVGSTNFQSVINLFVNLKNSGVKEEDFPTGILCISDSEFNPASLGRTNVDAAKDTLKRAGFSAEYVNNFVIVLWNLQSSYYGSGTGKKFETYGDVQNVFYFSGYSAATVGFLTSEIKTAAELADEALNQEVLQMVKL